ncbi:hypothetical protein VE02_10230 [Pseudogymnoascus sp. 03VT05]|nr:hypothetical protein VE02_10230 [Pseudogymnoascus sp. 03VT05]
MGKFLQVGSMRASRPTRPVWICLAIWLLMTSFFVHKAGQSKQTLVDQPTERWALDLRAGCPPQLAAPSPDPNIDAKLAQPLSAAELLCRPLPSDCSSEWVLWTNDDTLNLVRKYFPWLEEAYLELPGKIYRADFSRNLYMYIFGGVYADLDTDCLRPTSAVFEAFDIPNVENTTAGADGNHINQFAVFGRMGTNENFDNSIPNCVDGLFPGTPIFPHAPIEWTGPVALYNAILDFNTNGLSKEAAALAAVGTIASLAKKTKQEIVMLPSHWIYPYDWSVKELRPLCSAEGETFDAKACQERLEVDRKGSISITYWSHTHDNKNDNAKNIDSLSNK